MVITSDTTVVLANDQTSVKQKFPKGTTQEQIALWLQASFKTRVIGGKPRIHPPFGLFIFDDKCQLVDRSVVPVESSTSFPTSLQIPDRLPAKGVDLSILDRWESHAKSACKDEGVSMVGVLIFAVIGTALLFSLKK